jgi:rhodanese-related sulfurtransferase
LGWPGVSAFVLLLTVAMAEAGEPRIAADEAYRKAASGEITLIDIRTPQEWRESGIPAGALPITMHDPKGPQAFYRNVLAALDNDKKRPVALICARGYRSDWAQAFLARAGLTNVLDVSEGMFGRDGRPGWLKRGLPVERCTVC